jgi:sigma-B regulation protein RsbU (phosphoserine phosphatase)
MSAARATHPVLAALTEAAVGATGAAQGWLLAVDGEVLRVEAVAGQGAPAGVAGATVPAGGGSAGYVAASGQPMALVVRDDDPRFAEGVAALVGRRPTSLLSVPAVTADGVVGVLELVDKVGGGNFSFDDVELASMLAVIAGVALVHAEDSASSVPPPSELGCALERLAANDPTRYASVGTAVAALLARD